MQSMRKFADRETEIQFKAVVVIIANKLVSVTDKDCKIYKCM